MPLDKCCSATGTEWLLPSIVRAHEFCEPAADPGPSHIQTFSVIVYETTATFAFQASFPHSVEEDQLQFIHPAAMLLLKD